MSEDQIKMNDENMTKEEREVLIEANTKKEWESNGQWLKRKEFLLKMLKYHKKNNVKIDVDKFSKMGHIFYNMKYLSCTYSSQVVDEMNKYQDS
ncbi:XTBD domain-containing protein [Plasmodium brasilianum]|uniref:XRN2-binding (XTBD) domain-containing protein n=2 Tax=Plasmodium (Plasmodium) TaxID=418103 RepID=A0A1A8W374_PLAMA|nr:conserved Plasmodium protein, unknown function [Plasmodium malariae]KAI4838381.1 XTBD domain-containing protein [Plasmodium brasilianum]SBS85595.1 conserved Plasmodium protein, unknown function [Plasmodium malariae]SBT71361.1 conserved Plasmodium protein, unknown function [Plasmodium malariae]SCN12779.1 conserved Plasmodium protein, unknown function [Plasmodium malariae]